MAEEIQKIASRTTRIERFKFFSKFAKIVLIKGDWTQTMLQKIGLSVMIFTYLFAGVAHFLKRDYFLSLTPPFIPAPSAFVVLAGSVYIALAILLLFPKTRRAAFYAILLLLAIGIPLNLYMLSSATARGAIPREIILERIPFKALLMGWAFWLNWVERPKNRGRAGLTA